MIEGILIKHLQRIVDQRGWLLEMFRCDEWDYGNWPAQSYVSLTMPGVARGPHEHLNQTDLFCFFSSSFQISLWDQRINSKTFQKTLSIIAGAADPILILVPPGVVHGYRNVGDDFGLVINFPNRLYAGYRKAFPVDEIRHEGNSQFEI
jgi:dTDP-4-dehydrorhamnose 3,5-epimerase